MQKGIVSIMTTHLDEEAKVGSHGKATILELLHTQLSKGVGVVSQAKGIEWTTYNANYTFSPKMS